VKNTTIRLQEPESNFYDYADFINLYLHMLYCICKVLLTYVYVRYNYISATRTPLWWYLYWSMAFLVRQNYKMDVIYLQCTFILFRHWKDVNIGDYRIKRESLLGLLDGGHHVLLPL
jgi:hypothetical protein